MAMIATGQITIVDLTDGKSLSCYITSNLPKTQIYDPNTGTVEPNWAGSACLKLTPVVFVNQTAMPLTDSNLTISWKRRDGAGSETALTTGETVSDGVLTVNANQMSRITSGLLTYLAYITYTDPENGLTSNMVSDITFSQVKSAANARLVWISGEQVFKYSTNGTVSPAQISLTANLSNAALSKWQYKNAAGEWADYPITSDNAGITGTTLIVKPTHGIFVGDMATLRVVTSESGVEDLISIYKVRDGATGGTGASASMAFLTNENVTFAGNSAGQVAAVVKTCQVVAYTGAVKVTPTVGTITGAPAGMSVSKGAASGNEIPITIEIATNATLGGVGPQQGVLSVSVTSPVTTTLQIHWSKVNTGADGAPGEAAVVFSLYAPSGNVFLNGTGSLSIEASAYHGTEKITSGAAYVWKKYASGMWTVLTGQTDRILTVEGGSVDGMATYQCVMTYGDRDYTDTLTLYDKTDNYQASIESSGGDVFKNAVGSSTLLCRLFQNGQEVDADGRAHTYTWYRRDQNGNPMDGGAAFQTGKSIQIDGDDVAVKTTFICEVS